MAPVTTRILRAASRLRTAHPPGRAGQLSRRVRWLDRYRRILAIGTAIAVTTFVIVTLADAFGPAWPQFHAVMLGLVIGFFAWIALEVSFAWLTALWETEAVLLVRDRGLPLAVVHNPKTRKIKTTATEAAAVGEPIDLGID